MATGIPKRRTLEPSEQNPGSDNPQMEADKERQRQKQKQAKYATLEKRAPTSAIQRSYEHRAQGIGPKGTGSQTLRSKFDSVNRDIERANIPKTARLKQGKANYAAKGAARREALKRYMQRNK